MSNKINHKNVLLVVLCIISVLASFIVPDILLRIGSTRSLDSVNTAPSSYYIESGKAMAKNTSSNLTSLEQVKLVSGSWESIGHQCQTNEGFISESEAVELARSQLNYFYNTDVFPYAASASYNNWCSWEAKLYHYTDSLFETYSAYLWEITFTRFDNLASHTVYMTEKGVIISAITNDISFSPGSLINAYSDTNIKDILGDHHLTVLDKRKVSVHTEAISSSIAYIHPETDFSNISFKEIYVLDVLSSDGQQESYYIYQYHIENAYGIGFVPCNAHFNLELTPTEN